MAVDQNIFRALMGAGQLAAALNSGQAPQGGLNQPAQSGEPPFTSGGASLPAGTSTTPPQPDAQGRMPAPQTAQTVTPEQQQILSGANAPSPAAQAAAVREQRIVEGQNPQMAQQAQQQQPQPQNSPGAAPQQQQSALGNFSQEQIQQGAQGAQTASEKGLWDSIISNFTGGSGLTGQDLENWRKNMSLGTALGSLGAAIGGNTAGGRLGEGVYQIGAGNLAAKNAELREGAQTNFIQSALNALTGKQPTTQGAAQTQTQGSTMTQGQQAQNQPGAGNGGASALATDIVQSTANLDDIYNRMRRLNGIA